MTKTTLTSFRRRMSNAASTFASSGTRTLVTVPKMLKTLLFLGTHSKTVHTASLLILQHSMSLYADQATFLPAIVLIPLSLNATQFKTLDGSRHIRSVSENMPNMEAHHLLMILNLSQSCFFVERLTDTKRSTKRIKMVKLGHLS